MELATPRALAALLKRDKEILLSARETRVKQIPAASPVPATLLRDHVPHLIDELVAEFECPDPARARVPAFSAAHGEQRHEIGLQLPQVVEEYKIVRRCIVQRAEDEGVAVVRAASRIVNALIDEGTKSAIQAYIDRRDQTERSRRDEYLKFIVHDLRSPLAAVYYAILLVERERHETDVSARVRSMHAAIRRNIEQMRALIAKLLQEEPNLRTARHVEVRRAPVDVWPIVQSAARTLGSMAANAQAEIIPGSARLEGRCGRRAARAHL